MNENQVLAVCMNGCGFKHARATKVTFVEESRPFVDKETKQLTTIPEHFVVNFVGELSYVESARHTKYKGEILSGQFNVYTTNKRWMNFVAIILQYAEDWQLDELEAFDATEKEEFIKYVVKEKVDFPVVGAAFTRADGQKIPYFKIGY